MAEKVLLIDDEKEFLEVMSERMRARGINVTTCASAREALKKIETTSFDAIILDLKMPEMDGLETLKVVKEKRPETQIILLTGHATVEKGVEAMKLGAMDFVEKPADLETLTKKIKEAQARKMMIVEKKTKESVEEMLKRYGI
jgi:DNA-binding NtrC family response regulator